MKAISEYLYQRGARGIMYVRVRIPSEIRLAYPPKKEHISRSLGTSDVRVAKIRLRHELVRIQEEFDERTCHLQENGVSGENKRVASLSDDQLVKVTQFWTQSILKADEYRRQQGIETEEFDELTEQLKTQRAEFGRMLAQGKSESFLPALRQFISFYGWDFNPSGEQAKRASYLFLQGVVKTLDYQLARLQGQLVETDVVVPVAVHPNHIIDPASELDGKPRPKWDAVFEVWKVHTPNRPKSTVIASQTPWRALELFAKKEGVLSPDKVTPRMMTAFVESMRARELAVPTINERLFKIRAIYRIATGKHLLTDNPAANTLGFKQSSVQKRIKRRLPFDESDLSRLFGSNVFVEHKRSQGQSGEASYWLPLILFYSGARPEEVAGLALKDICEDRNYGWYLNLIDRPSDEDRDLFDDVPISHRRTLKNGLSIRRVPVAKELIDLGLLRYVEWLRERGETVLFPTLKKDWHGKLSGAFSKFFGRYKQKIGIQDPKKVLYSLRHTMKDLLESAKVPSKYLQRLLGHATGDGSVTDGYGSDLPHDQLLYWFSQVQFPKIPAQPWQVGTGSVRLQRPK